MASNQWLSRTILQRSISNLSNDSMMSADINVDNDDNRAVGSKQVENNGGAGVGGGGGRGVVNWENAREKSVILTHPLYEQLLSAHVGCLRIATPVDQLARIDGQLAQSQHVVAKYSSQLGHGNVRGQDDKELDQFMVRSRLGREYRISDRTSFRRGADSRCRRWGPPLVESLETQVLLAVLDGV